MKARLIRLGNSGGVRLATSLLDDAGLTDEVEIRAQDGAVIITSIATPRAGWAAAAAAHRREGLLDAPTPTRFDDETWEW